MYVSRFYKIVSVKSPKWTTLNNLIKFFFCIKMKKINGPIHIQFNNYHILMIIHILNGHKIRPSVTSFFFCFFLAKFCIVFLCVKKKFSFLFLIVINCRIIKNNFRVCNNNNKIQQLPYQQNHLRVCLYKHFDHR